MKLQNDYICNSIGSGGELVNPNPWFTQKLRESEYKWNMKPGFGG